MATAQRQGVIVLGMHRGGTSAIAGTACHLGMASPATPVPAATDNPSGFYESLRVVYANHCMLVAAGCTWDNCLAFDPIRLHGMLLARDRQHLADTLRQEFGHAPCFVLKDPRLCLTLPVWLPALLGNQVSPHALITVRHPAEVARSLASRNNITEAATAAHWLHHLLEAERASRGLPRAVIFYDDLLRDWRTCVGEAARIAGFLWPRPIAHAQSAIDAFLSASSRHHHADHSTAAIGPPPLAGMIDTAWNAFRALAGDPASGAALTSLEHLHARFASWRRATIPVPAGVTLPREASASITQRPWC